MLIFSALKSWSPNLKRVKFSLCFRDLNLLRLIWHFVMWTRRQVVRCLARQRDIKVLKQSQKSNRSCFHHFWTNANVDSDHAAQTAPVVLLHCLCHLLSMTLYQLLPCSRHTWQVMQVHLSEAARLRSCLACSTAFCTKLPIWRAFDSAVRAKTSSGIEQRRNPWHLGHPDDTNRLRQSLQLLGSECDECFTDFKWSLDVIIGSGWFWLVIMKPQCAVPPPMPQSVMPPFHHSRCWRMLAASLDLNPGQWKLDKRTGRLKQDALCWIFIWAL